MSIFPTTAEDKDIQFDRAWKHQEQMNKVQQQQQHQSEEDENCLCGKRLDESGPDCYSHMTQGY